METELFKIIYREWATVTAHSQAFLATLAGGLLVGWAAAWLILKQRLIHHREMLDQYKEALAKKGPKPKVAPQKSPLPLFSRWNMLIGLCTLVAIVLSPTYLLLRAAGPSAEVLYRATLQFGTLFAWKAPGETPSRFNIQVNNSGNFPALHTVLQVSGRIEDHELTQKEVQNELDKLNKQLAESDAATSSSYEVRVGQASVVTLPGMTVTDQEFQQVVPLALKPFYVFWVANYDDEIREGKSHWHAEFCGYFIATLNFWHNCSPNRIQLISKPRYELNAYGG